MSEAEVRPQSVEPFTAPNIQDQKIGDLTELPVDYPQNDQEQKRLIGYVQDRIDASREWDRPFKERCLDDWRRVNSRLPENWPYYWGIFQPETMIACNDTIENMMSTVFPKDNFFDLRASSGQTEFQTELLREAVRFAMRKAKYKERYFYWEQDAIFYGNGVLATFAEPQWLTSIVRKPVLDPYGYGVQIGMQREKQVKLSVWPQMRNVSRWNVFPSVGPVEGGDIQRMPYFIIRRFMPLVAVKAMAKKPWAMWQNTEKLKGSYNINRTTGTISNADETLFEDLWDLLWYAGFNVTTQQSEGTNCMKWCEVYYYYEAPAGGEGCRAYAVTCENQLLACRGNEYEHAKKPLADIKWTPIHPDLWQCAGVPSEMKAYQEIVNIKTSQRFELSELLLRPPRLVGKSSGINPISRLNPWPGSMTETNDVNSVKMLEFPNIRGDLFGDDQDAKVGIQRATRISNVSKGIADPNLGEGATRTAKGMAIMNASTKSASNYKSLFHEEIGIAPQITQFAQILQQTMEPGTLIHIGDVNETLKKGGVTGDTLQLHPDDIAGEWEFYAVGSSKVSDPAIEAQNAQAFWTPVLSDPEHGKKFDRMEIYKDNHERIFNRPFTKYLKTEQELQAAIQTPPPVAPAMLPKYKDAPPDIQRQIEQRAGLQPSEIGGASRVEQSVLDHAGKAFTDSNKQPRFLPKRES